MEEVTVMHSLALCHIDLLPRSWNRLAFTFELESRLRERCEIPHRCPWIARGIADGAPERGEKPAIRLGRH
jgi:hypothetical protein